MTKQELSSKGDPMKRVTIILTFIMLLIWCFSLSAADTTKDGNKSASLNQVTQEIMKSQGVTVMKSIDCSKVTDKQLEDLGDAFMDVIHPDSSEHNFMDRMMRGEKSPTLSAMKRIMGARYLGCYRGDEYSGMMSLSWGGRGSRDLDDYSSNRKWSNMMHGYGPWGMMGGYGMGLMWIIPLIIIVLVIVLVIRWARPAGVAETPIDILKKRYAKGEITKDEFDQKKKDLGL
jgi:putative membrane protein